MTDLFSQISALHRPQLLVRAAHAGLLEYNRNRDLKRLMRSPTAPTPERALKVLLAEEEQIEEARRVGGKGYSLTRHIDLLIALMAEIRLLPKTA